MLEEGPSQAPPLNASFADIGITFLTLNIQKARDENPSLADDIVAMLDHHAPNFLLLTETPLHPHSGALTHVLRNQGYKFHLHPANAESHQDILPKARLPSQLTLPK